MFSKRATKIDQLFTIDLTLCSKCQTNSEDFIDFCGLLRKPELYELLVIDYFLGFKATTYMGSPLSRMGSGRKLYYGKFVLVE